MRVFDWIGRLMQGRNGSTKDDSSKSWKLFSHGFLRRQDWHESQGSGRYEQDQSKVDLIGKVYLY